MSNHETVTLLTYAVLTPTAIYEFPKMLAVENPLYKLVIPRQFLTSALLEELSHPKKRTSLRLLIETAVEEDIVEVKDTEIDLASSEDAIIGFARGLETEGKPVIIIAGLLESVQFRRSTDWLSIINSIGILNTDDFRSLLNASKSTIKPELLALVKGYKKRRLKIPRKVNWWIQLVEFGVLMLFATHTDAVLSFLFRLNIWISALVVLGFSVFLFWYRAQHRFYYGILESVFGLLVSSSVLYSNLDYSRLLAVDYIKLVSGVYIIIRGLDNVEKGLPYIDSERIKELWRKWFEPPPPRI